MRVCILSYYVGICDSSIARKFGELMRSRSIDFTTLPGSRSLAGRPNEGRGCIQYNTPDNSAVVHPPTH